MALSRAQAGQLLRQPQKLQCLSLEQERVDRGVLVSAGLQLGVGCEQNDLYVRSKRFEQRRRIWAGQRSAQGVIENDDPRFVRACTDKGFLCRIGCTCEREPGIWVENSLNKQLIIRVVLDHGEWSLSRKPQPSFSQRRGLR